MAEKSYAKPVQKSEWINFQTVFDFLKQKFTTYDFEVNVKIILVVERSFEHLKKSVFQILNHSWKILMC